MKFTRFSLINLEYVLLLLVLKCSLVQMKKDSINCKDFKTKNYFENFYMQIAVCRKHISVGCFTKATHPCFKTHFQATAYVEGQQGQCLIAANVTQHKTLQFYVETKRTLNPNEEGSRKLGGQERHQKGKCLLKYYCYQKKLINIYLNCGTVAVNEKQQTGKVRRQSQRWKAPPNFNGFVIFNAKIAAHDDQREVDVSSARLFVAGGSDDDRSSEILEQMAVNLNPKKKKVES